METRKESLSALKVCRFCLTQNESLTSLYEKSKAPKNMVTLSTKIMTCVAIEVFPSDKMPQYICNRCKLFMDLSYGFKQICRQADQNILHFVQSGATIEPLTWPTLLSKVYKAHTKAEFGAVKTVMQDGTTVKVTAEEISDSEEGDDDNVYSVKIGDGSDELKSIKVITSVDNQATAKESRKVAKYNSDDEPSQTMVKEGCWPCDECDCTYPLEQLLTLHKAQKHRERIVECDECDAKFFSKYDLSTHQLRHSTEFPFQCVACDKKFKRLVLLKRHEKLIHSDLPQIKCSKCPATFLSSLELEAHQMKHGSLQPRRFECSLCDKRFIEDNALQKHLETVHKKKSGFNCNYCPERFSNITKLAKHLRSHAGERAYPCKHCDKSFLKSHHYTRHLRVKHSDTIRTASGSYAETVSYSCEECDESFNTQDDLIYHSALHATRNLTCPLCQEKFHDVDTVTAHVKSHVNGAEFMCDFCELIFTTQDKLDTHIAISHDSELNDKDLSENEDDDYSMDAEGSDEDDNSINLKEEDGQMVVEIKKAGDYILADTVPMDEDENNVIDQSEGSELEISLNDATGPLLALKPARIDGAPKPPVPAKSAETLGFVKGNPGSPIIFKKAEEFKRKTVQQQPSPVPSNTEKKEKSIAKVENTGAAAAGASDLSLRLLEKELQDLQRTNTRDVVKTPARQADATVRSKRSQMQTSTPKPRPVEKKEIPAPKAAPEKPPPEKRPPGRPPKDKEVKNPVIKEDKEAKDKGNGSVKEEKETKEVKEKDTPKVVKNGSSDRSSVEEPVRRSTRPCKVKDYAKMIRDSPDEDEVSDDDEEEEEPEETKETDKSIETPRRGRKPLPKSPAAVSPGTAPKKRGRPRKMPSVVPPKIFKKEENDEVEASHSETIEDTKSNEENSKVADNIKTETKTQPTESNVIVSPCGQTLKKVPIKALPPGIKPMPLPRKMTSGEVCEMQIGKKVVKVQKIVMTKAEVEAMTKKGLVEMKDGTIVLKQGIRLPGGSAATLKSQLAAEEQKKESPKSSKPTRCDLGED